MRKAVTLYRTSIGKKLVMAVSGVMLFGFVVAHLLGNLKVFFGPQSFDAYAHHLREMGADLFGDGGLLWILRLGLLAALAAHVVAVVQLSLQSARARTVGYRRGHDLAFSYASRTMRWGGILVLAFVVYHLMHLTFGNVHPDFHPESPYRNVVTAFRVWWVALPYAVAVGLLGLHLYHGLWSATQTLSLRYRVVLRWRRAAAAAIAGAIVAGYLSIPLAVLAGWVA